MLPKMYKILTIIHTHWLKVLLKDLDLFRRSNKTVKFNVLPTIPEDFRLYSWKKILALPKTTRKENRYF